MTVKQALNGKTDKRIFTLYPCQTEDMASGGQAFYFHLYGHMEVLEKLDEGSYSSSYVYGYKHAINHLFLSNQMNVYLDKEKTDKGLYAIELRSQAYHYNGGELKDIADVAEYFDKALSRKREKDIDYPTTAKLVTWYADVFKATELRVVDLSLWKDAGKNRWCYKTVPSFISLAHEVNKILTQVKDGTLQQTDLPNSPYFACL